MSGTSYTPPPLTSLLGIPAPATESNPQGLLGIREAQRIDPKLGSDPMQIAMANFQAGKGAYPLGQWWGNYNPGGPGASSSAANAGAGTSGGMTAAQLEEERLRQLYMMAALGGGGLESGGGEGTGGGVDTGGSSGGYE